MQFRETVGDAVKRNLAEELGVSTIQYEVISVNANYEKGNHYIGIGILAEIAGDIQMKNPEDWDTWEWFDLDVLLENLFCSRKKSDQIVFREKSNGFRVTQTGLRPLTECMLFRKLREFLISSNDLKHFTWRIEFL